MTRPTVLVLGANGRFGQAAVQAFVTAGWSVWAQVRRTPAAPLPEGATTLEIPLADAAALAARAAGAGVVVHAVNPIYTEWRHSLLPMARQGMDVARRLDARFMLPGNVYNYGRAMPPLLCEHTPERPTTEKGRLRVELEAELAARSTQGLRSTVIRAGDFFGSGRGSWLDLAIVKSLAQGKLVYPGPLDLPHAWAYLPDLARAFVAVAARDDRAPFTRLHFEGHTLTGRSLLEAVERVADALGLHPARGWRRGTVPWALMRPLGWLVPMLREVVEMAYLWQVPHALDGSSLRAAVGDLATTPLDAALRASLVDLGLARPEAAGGRAPEGIVAVSDRRRHPA